MIVGVPVTIDQTCSPEFVQPERPIACLWDWVRVWWMIVWCRMSGWSRCYLRFPSIEDEYAAKTNENMQSDNRSLLSSPKLYAVS
jgi:hypothetical protein